MFLAGICDQSAGSPSEDHDTTTTHPVLFPLHCTVYTCICQVMLSYFYIAVLLYLSSNAANDSIQLYMTYIVEVGKTIVPL